MGVQTAIWIGYSAVSVIVPILVTVLAVRRLARRFATEINEVEVLGYEVESYETDRQVTLAVFSIGVLLTTWLTLVIGLGSVLHHFGLLP